MKRHRIRLGINPAVWLPFGVGLIAAAATFLLLGQIRSATHPARTTWFVIAIALLVVGSITTVLGIAAASQQWHESRATPLELAHDSRDIQCVQRRASDLELRIKVRNTGQFDLRRVRARLERDGSPYAHWLRVRHDNAAPYRRSQEGETLPADSSYWLYFDVVFSNYTGIAIFEYADEYLRLEDRTTDPMSMLTIRVWASRESDGRSVVPAERRFRLDVSDRGRAMKLTADDDLTTVSRRRAAWPRCDGLFGASSI